MTKSNFHNFSYPIHVSTFQGTTLKELCMLILAKTFAHNHAHNSKSQIFSKSQILFLRQFNQIRGGGTWGGGRGPWPPQKFEWVGQGMFWPPPQNFDHWPPKWLASCQNLCQIASEHFEMCKDFKIFCLRVKFILQVISCCLERIVLPCNIR